MPLRPLKPTLGLHRAGFTLVEFVTIVLIAGVLAAVALPRFADYQGKARVAKIKAAAGSMKAVTGLVKASALASQVSCADASGTNVLVEGMNVALNHCYPQALGRFGTGILGVANLMPSDGWMVGEQAGSAQAGAKLTVYLGDAVKPEGCSITYTAAADAQTPPLVSTTLTDC